MPRAPFREDEIDGTRALYPGLARVSNRELEGLLRFDATHDGHPIVDSYRIRILADNRHSEHLPAMEETGGRTEAIAAKCGITDLRRLHRNPDGTACMCPPQLEKEKFPPGADLPVFIQELVIPYLYGLSFFDAKGRWPWGEYGHGALGVLECYGEFGCSSTPDELRRIAELLWRDAPAYRKQLRRPSGKRPCLCGSKRPFRDCHSLAWKGLKAFRDAFKRSLLD